MQSTVESVMMITGSQKMSGEGVMSWFEGWCRGCAGVIVGLEWGGFGVAEGWVKGWDEVKAEVDVEVGLRWG